MAGTVYTPVDMVNLALSHIDEPRIQALDSTNKASRWFLQHYQAHRDAVLAMHDWDFALRLANLPADVARPPFRWDYQYQLPADWARIPGQREKGERDGPRIKFEVIGGKLMTDYEAPFPLRYVSKDVREADFSPLFVTAFGLYLAAACAHLLAGKNSLADRLDQKFREAIDAAQVADAITGEPAPMEDSDAVLIR